jgi:ABC-type amino acid transport substrate-binding protein
MRFIAVIAWLLVCAPGLAQVEVTPLESAPNRDAERLPLTVGVRIGPPFVIKQADGYSGLAITLWERIATEMAVEYEYRELPLDPLLDQAASGEIDVAVGALSITPEREQRLDFSHPYFRTGLAIASRQEASGLMGALARLFSLDFALAIGSLFALLAAIGALAWLAERKANPEQFGGTAVQGLGEGIWWAAVTMTTVGYGDRAPVSKLGRLLGLVWMFAAIVLISGFTAAIASSLTIGQLSSRIQSPNDLKNVDAITLADSTSAAWLDSRRIQYDTRGTLAEAMDALANGEAQAVVFDEPLLRYELIESPRAGVDLLPFTLEPQDYGLAFRENSELREPINRALLKVTNTGMWQNERRRYLGD